MVNYNIFENIEQAKSFLRKNDLSTTSPMFNEIRKVFHGNEGYIGWVTKLLYDKYIISKRYEFDKNKILRELNEIHDTIINNKNLIQYLPKPIIQYESYEELLDGFEKSKLFVKAKKIYDQFPTQQKSFIDLTNEEHISLLSKLYDDKLNKSFIRKISSLHSKQQLFKRLKDFLEGDRINTDSFNKLIEYLKNNKLEIVHESQEYSLVIARIFTYDQCETVGKKTSWCIARSSSTFKQYVPNIFHSQYIIYFLDLPNTDDDKIIGCTTNFSKIIAIHNVVDRSIRYDELKTLLEERNFDINNLLTKIDEKVLKEIDKYNFNTLIHAGLDKEYILKYKIDLINDTSVSSLKNDFSKKEILDHKEVYREFDLKEFSKTEIEEYDLNNKLSISGLKIPNFTKDEIIEKNIIKRTEKDSIHLYNLVIKGFNKEELLKIPYLYRKLTSDDKNYYDEYMNKKPEDFKNIKSFVVKSSYYKMDVSNTIINLMFYNTNPEKYTFKDILSIFSFSQTHQLEEILKYLKDYGYTYIDEEIIPILRDIFYNKNREKYVWTLFSFIMCDNGFDLKDEFLNDVCNFNEPIDKEFSLKYITDILKDNKKGLNKFLLINQRNKFIYDSNDVSRYQHNFKIVDKKDKLTPEQWYEKWGHYGMVIDWNSIPFSQYDFQGGFNVPIIILSYISIIMKLGKIQDLYQLKYDSWDVNVGSSDDINLFYMICKIIDKTFKSNNDFKFRILNDVPEESFQKLYTWLIEHVYKTQISDKEKYGKLLQIVSFLYDKERFYRYVDVVKRMKNNYEYEHDSKNVKGYKTFRIKELKLIMKYLLESYYVELDNNTRKEYFFEIIEYFLGGLEMSNTEKKDTIEFIESINSEKILDKNDMRNIIRMIGLNENILTNYNIYKYKIIK